MLLYNGGATQMTYIPSLQDLADGKTLLRAGVRGGSTKIVTLLLDRGADATQTHPKLGSLLHTAMEIDKILQRPKMIKLLLERGNIDEYLCAKLILKLISSFFNLI